MQGLHDIQKNQYRETNGSSQHDCRPTCTLPMSWLPALGAH